MKNIGILGGDLRIIKLAEFFAEEEKITYIYGLENNKFSNKHIIECKSIDEVSRNCDYVISGIPFSKNKEDIETPFSDKTIKIKDILEELKGKTLIAGEMARQKRDCCSFKIS